MAHDIGRPGYPDEQFEIWLKEMRPFLEQGKSIYRSIELCGLLTQKDPIYRKYRIKDWFSEKVDAYQKVMGETVNDIYVTLIGNINKKVKNGEALTEIESKQLSFYAEKSRAAQSYFVNRFEAAKGKPIEEILDQLEANATNDNIDDVASQIEAINADLNGNQQITPATTIEVVAVDSSLQDQG